MKQRSIRGTWSRVAAASLLAAAGALYAQPTGLTRTVLTRADAIGIVHSRYPVRAASIVASKMSWTAASVMPVTCATIGT